MKKFFALLLSFVMILSMSLTAFASERPDNDCLAVLEDGTKVIAAYRIIDGEMTELTEAEYLAYKHEEAVLTANKEQLKNSHVPATAAEPRMAGVPFTWYDERGVIEEYTRTSLRTRVSTYVYNRGSNDATRTITGTYTQGFTANYTLSSGEKSAIKQEVGFSFTDEFTFSEEISTIISPGCKGWMEFTPIMHNTYGYIQKGVTTAINPFYVITSETWTDVYFPRELPSGQLDGIYEIMESPI